MIIRWFQGVYLLTEVEENSAIIDMRSSSGWHPLWLSMGVSDRSIESSLSCFSSFTVRCDQVWELVHKRKLVEPFRQSSVKYWIFIEPLSLIRTVSLQYLLQHFTLSPRVQLM